MPTVLPLPAEEAIAAVAAVAGPAPKTGKYVGQLYEDSFLTLVTVQDSLDRGFPNVWVGGGWMVGPDGKVFALSSNYGIHDWRLARTLLIRLYGEGLASRIEPEVFVERLERLTRERDDLVEQVVREAKEGRLRPPRPRVLP